MTSKKDEIEEGLICKECQLYQGGYCVKGSADHFGHAIAPYHPGCDVFAYCLEADPEPVKKPKRYARHFAREPILDPSEGPESPSKMKRGPGDRDEDRRTRLDKKFSYPARWQY